MYGNNLDDQRPIDWGKPLQTTHGIARSAAKLLAGCAIYIGSPNQRVPDLGTGTMLARQSLCKDAMSVLVTLLRIK